MSEGPVLLNPDLKLTTCRSSPWPDTHSKHKQQRHTLGTATALRMRAISMNTANQNRNRGLPTQAAAKFVVVQINTNRQMLHYETDDNCSF